MTPGQLYDELHVYSHRFPFSISSGGRTRKHNEAVGGGINSKHMTWHAFDLMFDDKRDESPCMALMRRDHLDWDVVNEGDHVHVEWDPKGR